MVLLQQFKLAHLPAQVAQQMLQLSTTATQLRLMQQFRQFHLL